MSSPLQLPNADVRDEGNGRGRPWSIGSELLGHYGGGSTTEHNRPSHEANRQSSDQTDGIINIYDGTQRAAIGDGDLDMEGEKPQFSRASTNAFDRVVTDWWWWELLSWLISAICVGAIVIVLLLYSEQPLPHWPLGITLNAYISVLAALAKAALMLPVAEAIGQLKWIWFRRKSKLMDFFTFDSASRGPWGSFMLLSSTRCRHLASLGAIITILALAFETFFQQIVSYPERPIIQGNSSVSTAVSYDAGISPNTVLPTLANDPLMRTTIQAAIFGSNETIPSPPSTCPGSNCTWPQYSSLGVCSQCKDVSTLLQYFCKNHTAITLTGGTFTEFACGYVLNGTLMVGTYLNGVIERQVQSMSIKAVTGKGGVPRDASLSGPQFNSTLFKDVAYPILDFYVGYTPGGRDSVVRNNTPIMMECLLNWCVKSYRSSQSQGVLNETVTNTFVNDTASRLSTSEILSGIPPVVLTPPGQSTTFHVPNGTTEALTSEFLSFLSDFSITEMANATGMSSFNGIYNFVMVPPYDINLYLEPITTAMTNNMRRKLKGTAIAMGTAWGSQTFVRIRWYWISLPGFLLLATLAFIVCTIMKSSRQKVGVWKTSALAMLLHGLTEEVRCKLDPKWSASELESAARKIEVVLSPDKESALLVPG